MGPRKSKVPETNKQIFFSRIEEFAGAIHSYGVENLYKELRSKAYITESYPLETFRTDFKRMKNSENGLLNEPAMLGGILEILHFPADALFGGPSASIEDNRETVKATIINTMQDIEKQKRTPQKRIFNSRMIDRAWKVHNIIRNNYSLSYPQLGYFLNEPFRLLFAGYSAQDKSWDHAKETRIKTILENILKGSKGSSYYYYYPNMSPPFFSPSADPYDTYWNNCLIISYQLSCIESLYSIFQKSKKTKKHTQKGQPVFIDSPTIIQNVTLENEGQDIFAVEFDKSCKSFDDMISNSKYLPTAGFLKIISNFQEILRTLLCPKWTNTVPQNPLGDSLIYQFIQPTNVFINNFELEITDKEINMLRENAKLLTDQNMGAVNQSSENHSNIVQKIPKDAYNIGQEERLLTYEEQDRMIDEDASTPIGNNSIKTDDLSNNTSSNQVQKDAAGTLKICNCMDKEIDMPRENAKLLTDQNVSAANPGGGNTLDNNQQSTANEKKEGCLPSNEKNPGEKKKSKTYIVLHKRRINNPSEQLHPEIIEVEEIDYENDDYLDTNWGIGEGPDDNFGEDDL